MYGYFQRGTERSYSDNSKYLYKYVLATRPAIRAFWVAKDPALYLSMTSQGLPCVYAYSLKGVYFQLIAGVLFFSHCVDWEFCSYLIAPRAKRIQLWHGMPIKHIGYDDSLNQQSSMKSALIKFMLPFRSEAFDFIIALGQRDKAIYQSAFQIRPEKVRVTGFPRNDASVRKRSQEEKSVLDILYLPTFRGVPGSEFGLFSEEGFVFQEVDNWLNERHCKLHIKLHPVNKLASRDLQQIHLSHNIALFDESDIYEKLHLFDVFVTDFSSVYFDCLVTGKPIILAPIKLNDYLKKERGGFLIFPRQNWLLGRSVQTGAKYSLRSTAF